MNLFEGMIIQEITPATDIYLVFFIILTGKLYNLAQIDRLVNSVVNRKLVPGTVKIFFTWQASEARDLTQKLSAASYLYTILPESS